MSKRRRGVRCQQCGRNTRSATRYCRVCRPESMIPPVHALPFGLVSFEGITLTTDQARRLADALHEAADKAVMTP